LSCVAWLQKFVNIVFIEKERFIGNWFKSDFKINWDHVSWHVEYRKSTSGMLVLEIILFYGLQINKKLLLYQLPKLNLLVLPIVQKRFYGYTIY